MPSGRARAIWRKSGGTSDAVTSFAAADREGQAAKDIQRAQGGDDRGDAAEGDQQAVDGAKPGADEQPDDDGQPDREIGVVAEDVADDVGDQADRRGDRKVDVARQDDQRLADGDDGDDRDGNKDLADVAGAEVAGCLDADDDDDRGQGNEQAGLADPPDQIDKPAGTGRESAAGGRGFRRQQLRWAG